MHRVLGKAAMQRIGAAVTESENSHLGEVRFVVEAVLPWQMALRGVSARERAIGLFSDLRLWDTELNSGVLVYLLLADRDVEIVADRGIHARVGEAGWQAICHAMETRFRNGEFENGVLEGIASITSLLAQHFPARDGDNPNEILDAPVVL